MYAPAIVLSILIHLFFVTAVEAFTILTPSVPVSLVSWKLVKQAVSIQKKEEPLSSTDIPKASKAFVKSATKTEKPFPSFGPNQSNEKNELFQNSQKGMDERIKKIRRELIEIKEEALDDYLKQMRMKIAEAWAEELKMLPSGSAKVVLEYQLDRTTGAVENLKVLEHEGNDFFYRVCVRSVVRSGPFGSVPAGFAKGVTKGSVLSVALTFRFYEGSKKETSFKIERLFP